MSRARKILDMISEAEVIEPNYKGWKITYWAGNVVAKKLSDPKNPEIGFTAKRGKETDNFTKEIALDWAKRAIDVREKDPSGTKLDLPQPNWNL